MLREQGQSPPIRALYDGAASLLLEWVVARLWKAADQNIVVLSLLAVLDDLGDRLRDGHPVRRGLDAQLLDELALRLQALLKLAHGA